MKINSVSEKPLYTIALIAIGALYLANVYRLWFLSDDAFISFRYALHLTEGEGLVWNAGERVEGYTNFLWVVVLAVGMLAGFAPEGLSTVLGVLSGIGILLLVFRFAVASQKNDLLLIILLLTLAVNRSFAAWSTSGLETMFFSFLCFGGVCSFLSAIQKGKQLLLPAVLLSLATLTRPEGALFMGLVSLFYLGHLIRNRQRLNYFFQWLTPYLIIVGAHLCWRIYYYGYPLPNTFYAKVSGLWIEQAIHYLTIFQKDYFAACFIPLVLLSAAVRRDMVTALFAAILICYLGYVMAIGGDRFEFRFLIVVLPYFYWLLVDGIRVLKEFIDARISRGGALVVTGILSVALLGTTLHGLWTPDAKKVRHGIASIEGIRRYALKRSEEGTFLRTLVTEGLLPADTVIAVGGAGALPYYSQLPTVDRRGLNDTYIAHLPLEERGIIAHERDAPYEYLQKRHVAMFDVLNQLVHKKEKPKRARQKIVHDGTPLRMVMVRANDKYLIFATFLKEEELRQRFSKLEIISVSN